MNWFAPNRFIPRSRFERNKVLEWLEGEINPSNDDQFAQRLVPNNSSQGCIMNGNCTSLKSPINYGDESLMQSQNIGFYTSELMKGKWDGYYKYRNHLMWQDDGSAKYVQIPMLHPDAYDTIYKKFEEISLMPTVYETGGHLDYKQDNYVHVDPEVLKTRGGVKTLVIEGPAPGKAHPIEFHIHPNSCRRGSKTCGLGWPSTADLDNILKRHWMGNKSHVVFAYEGTYTVFVKPEWRQDKMEAARALDNIQEEIKVIVQDFMSNKRSYEDSVPLWTQTVNKDTSPLHVLFAPLGNGPLIPNR
jgi:hypothetical protein